MTNRALLVGINAYPSPNRLSGCINDIEDMSSYLQSACGFGAGDIQTITDKQATTANILAALEAFVASLAPGDRALFHYSGHGAQMPSRTSGEIDGLDEVICPVDFDWSDAHAIRDDDFNRIFAAVPAGVELVWISDSCHSGTLTKALPPFGVTFKERRILPPKRIRDEIAKASSGPKAIAVRPLTPPTKLNVGLISGCRSDQTSADALIDGRYNGAATYYLLRALQADPTLPLGKVVQAAGKALNAAHYSQDPGTFGSHAIRDRAFLVA